MSTTIDFRGGQPHHTASHDETRWAITHVAIDCGHAISTSGRALYCQSLTMSGDELRGSVLMLKAAAVELATTPRRATAEDDEGVDYEYDAPLPILSTDGDQCMIDDSKFSDRKVIMPNSNEASFPKWWEVIPDYGTRTVISLDASILSQIAKAFGDELQNRVCLHIGGPEDSIIISSGNPRFHDRFAILMPCKGGDYSIAENTAYQHALERKSSLAGS